eukprot:jgi/Chrzof1/10851/Cz05g14150.t1
MRSMPLSLADVEVSGHASDCAPRTTPGFSISGRNFPPESAVSSPGPQAYSPRVTACLTAPGSMVFGSGSREQCAKVYVSPEYSKVEHLGHDAPGPGTYRSEAGHMFISKQHMTVDPGPTAANTPSGADYCVAGKADLLSSVKKAAAFSFGSEKKGLEFKAKQYLSPEHIKCDPSLSDSPGPVYNLPGSISSSGVPGKVWTSTT